MIDYQVITRYENYRSGKGPDDWRPSEIGIAVTRYEQPVIQWTLTIDEARDLHAKLADALDGIDRQATESEAA